MKSTQEAFSARLPFAVFALIFFWGVAQIVFARFVHYHAQHHVLQPEHYTASVVSVADAPTRERFRLSEDGAYLVQVRALGTAHHFNRTVTDLLPLVLLSIAGMGAIAWSQRRRRTNGA